MRARRAQQAAGGEIRKAIQQKNRWWEGNARAGGSRYTLQRETRGGKGAFWGGLGAIKRMEGGGPLAKQGVQGRPAEGFGRKAKGGLIATGAARGRGRQKVRRPGSWGPAVGGERVGRGLKGREGQAGARCQVLLGIPPAWGEGEVRVAARLPACLPACSLPGGEAAGGEARLRCGPQEGRREGTGGSACAPRERASPAAAGTSGAFGVTGFPSAAGKGVLWCGVTAPVSLTARRCVWGEAKGLLRGQAVCVFVVVWVHKTRARGRERHVLCAYPLSRAKEGAGREAGPTKRRGWRQTNQTPYASSMKGWVQKSGLRV